LISYSPIVILVCTTLLNNRNNSASPHEIYGPNAFGYSIHCDRTGGIG
jgi:hypothetical protein